MLWLGWTWYLLIDCEGLHTHLRLLGRRATWALMLELLLLHFDHVHHLQHILSVDFPLALIGQLTSCYRLIRVRCANDMREKSVRRFRLRRLEGRGLYFLRHLRFKGQHYLERCSLDLTQGLNGFFSCRPPRVLLLSLEFIDQQLHLIGGASVP